MKYAGISSVIAAFVLGASLSAYGQRVNDEPLKDNWAPSEWGPDDKVGAVNRTTPDLVLKAVGLVKRGTVATLGKVCA